MTTFQGKLKNEDTFWAKFSHIITTFCLMAMVIMNILLGFRIDSLKEELLTCQEFLSDIEASETLQ